MIHYGSWGGVEVHSKDHSRLERENRKLRNIYRDVLLARMKEKDPNFPRSKLESMLQFDTYFSAKEALALGLADEIIG